MAKRRKRSALVELKRLEEAFRKNRTEILQRAKDEAVGAVGGIVKQLQIFATNFPDIVAKAVSHLADATTIKPKAGRPTTPMPTKVTENFKAKPQSATPAHVKSVLHALIAKDGVTNHQLVQVTKLNGGIISAALKQLRDEGKVKSSGQGRGTTWKITGK